MGLTFDEFKKRYESLGGASGGTGSASTEKKKERERYTEADVRSMLSPSGGSTAGRSRTYTDEDVKNMLGGYDEYKRKQKSYETYIGGVNNVIDKYNAALGAQSSAASPKYRDPKMLQGIKDAVDEARKSYNGAKNYSRYLSTDDEMQSFGDSLRAAKDKLDSIYEYADGAQQYYSQFRDEKDFDDYTRLSSMSAEELSAERDKVKSALSQQSNNRAALAEAVKNKDLKAQNDILAKSLYSDKGVFARGKETPEETTKKQELEDNYARVSAIYNSKYAEETQKNALADANKDKYIQSAKDAFNRSHKGLSTGFKAGSDFESIMLGISMLPASREYGLAQGQQLTDDEKSTFLYLAGKDGKDAAMDYYRSIEEKQNYKAGIARETLYDRLPLGKAFLPIAAGLDQFKTGAEGFSDMLTGSTEPSATSSIQYAGAISREKQDTLGKLYHDVVSNVAMNAPSMLISMGIGGPVGATVGSAVLGTTAAGNKYAEMINRGYDNETALTTGVMVGISETCFEKLLTSVGGAVKNPIVSKVKIGGKTIEDALATAAERIALKHPLLSRLITASTQTAGDFIGEFIEESLQDVLEPIIEAVTTGRDISEIEINIEQALYSGIVGGISGAMHSAIGQGANSVMRRTSYAGQAETVIQNGRADNALENALSFPEGSAARAYAEELKVKKDSGETITRAEMKALLEKVGTFAEKTVENAGKVSDEEMLETAQTAVEAIFGDTEPFKRNLETFAKREKELDIGENELRHMTETYKYQFGLPLEEYARTFDTFYKAGARNESWARVKNTEIYRASAYFDDGMRLAAYNAGLRTHEYRDGVNINFASEENRRAFEESDAGTAVRVMSELFAKEGYAKKIVITDRTYSENGERIALGSTKGNDTIILNYEDIREGGAAFFAGHEVGELMRINVPELYREASDGMLEVLADAYGKTGERLLDLVSERAELYGYDIATKQGQDAVQSELTNNLFGLYFSRPETIESMAKKNVSLVERIKDYFKVFLAKLKTFFGSPSVKLKYAEVEVIKAQADATERVISIAEAALEKYRAEIAEKQSKGETAETQSEGGKTADSDENAAYALAPEMRDEIDEYLEYAETNSELLTEFEKSLFDTMRTLKTENERAESENREIRKISAEALHYKRVYDEVMKENGSKQLSEADVNRALFRLGRDFYGKRLPDTIRKSITDFYTMLANSTPDTISAADVRSKAIQIGYQIVRGAAFADDTLRREHEMVRKALQGKKIYVSERDRSEIEHEFGRYGAVKNKLFGSKVYLTSDRQSGIPIDTLWQELGTLDAKGFPQDISTAEMFSRLLREAETWKYGTVNPFEADFEGATLAIANSILDEYANIREVKSRARLYAENKQLRDKVIEMREDFTHVRQKTRDEVYSGFERRKKRERLMRDAISLAKKVKSGRMPNELVSVVVDFERLFGYSRKRPDGEDTLKTKQLRDAQDGLGKYSTYGEHSGLRDYIDSFMKQDETQVSGLDREQFEAMRGFAEVFRHGKEPGEDFGRKNIDELTDAELDAAVGIADYFVGLANNLNKMHANEKYATVADAGMATIRELSYSADGSSVYDTDRIKENRKPVDLTKKYDGDNKFVKSALKKAEYWRKKVYDSVVLNSLDSFSLFYKLGDTAKGLFDSLYAGYEESVSLQKKATDYVEKIKKKHGVTIKDISEKHHRVKVGGKTVDITTAQAMDLYLTLRRGRQAKGHIEGLGFVLQDDRGNSSKILTFNANATDGLRFWEIAVGNTEGATENERAEIKKLRESLVGIGKENTILITENDLNKFTSVLEPNEVDFAIDMQKYIVDKISPHLNELSLKLYDTAKYTERYYWPIQSKGSYIERRLEAGAKDRRFDAILHKGFTKSLVDNANNVIVVGNAFRTFAKHVYGSTAMIGMGAPLADMTAWYNYKDGHYSVRSAIEDYLGKSATKYVEQFFSDLNGQNAGIESFGFWEKFFRNAKAAAVLFNARVAIQQHTSVVRAHLAGLDWRYIAKGEAEMLTRRLDIETVEQYCGTALVKSFGGWTTYVGESMLDRLSGESGTVQKIQNVGGYLAQKGDEKTLIALFGAAIREARNKDSSLEGEALLRAAGKRLTEICNDTQVIDTPFHRPGWMRSENVIAKGATAFMAEPMKTANIFFKLAGDWYHADKTGRGEAAKKIGTAFYTFVFNSALTAAASALVDVFRRNSFLDDDAEEDILKRYAKYWSNAFTDNLDPVSLNPVTKYIRDDILDAQLYKRSDLSDTAVAGMLNAAKETVKYLRGESKHSSSWIMLTALEALSSASGIPAYALFRDLRAGVTGTLEFALGDDPHAKAAIKSVVDTFFKK